MNTGILLHKPSDTKYAVYDVTESSFKSINIPYDNQWRFADKRDYVLNGTPIEITSSSIGFKELEVQYQQIPME